MKPTLQQLVIIAQDEQYILSELLLEFADISVIRRIISVDDFLIPKHREIWRIMVMLNDNGMCSDMVNVYRQADPELIGDALYLTRITRQNTFVCELRDMGIEPEPIEACCQRIKQYAAVFSSIRRIVWSAPKPRKMSDKEVNEYLYGGE